jgi:hypothetical protein
MPVPVKEIGPEFRQGPVLVTVEYIVSRGREADFVAAIHQYARLRRRDGAYRWGIFHDAEVADRYIEIFLVNSWAEHLRQHDRATKADLELEQRLRSCLDSNTKVRHLIYAYAKET